MKTKFKMKFIGEDGNAFSLLGRFSTAARKAGWEKSDIDEVVKECMGGDYDHLLRVLTENTIPS